MSDYALSSKIVVVDDTPDTLALLHDALVESGFTVLVANNGESALNICREASPALVLLDAVMPGIDGFEVCRQLKQDLVTRHIPVIFMTGLTESEHVVTGFSVGGIDYVTKPLSPVEVIARVNTHLRHSRMMHQTQGALDAFGQAAIAVLPATRKIIWQTPLARELLEKYLQDKEKSASGTPTVIQDWIGQLALNAEQQIRPLVIQQPTGRLIFNPADLHSEEQWLILVREESETAQIEALKAVFSLTKREAEVLHWVILGKTDQSIAEILGISPRTVNKHMEHVFEKLGVETRTAAASMAVNKLHSLTGQVRQ